LIANEKKGKWVWAINTFRDIDRATDHQCYMGMKAIKRLFSVLVVVFCIALNFGFTTFEHIFSLDKTSVKGPFKVLVGQEKTVPPLVPKYMTPLLENCFIGFKEALAFKESQGNYFIINELGYLGKYQFGIETLKLMGVSNENGFINSPMLQEEVFHINLKRNKWILRKDIKRSLGKTIDNIMITESGILAAAHLAGAGNVKKYLRSNGKLNVADAFGTRLSDYLKDFAGYDMSKIIASKNPRINPRE